MQKVDIVSLFGNDNTSLGFDEDGVLLNDADNEIRVKTGADVNLMNTSAKSRGQINFTITNSLVDANAADFNKFVDYVSTAVGNLNSHLNELGIDQRSLSSKEENLTQAITANSAAHSRIMDTDFAKEQSNSIRLQILQQTATAALSQANMGPQAVLGFLGQ